jgi:hypothetical protein
MNMTKKDYVLIAAALKAGRTPPREESDTLVNNAYQAQHLDIAYALSNALARENPRFDRARFLAACGVVS